MYTVATPVWRVEYINAKKTSFLQNNGGKRVNVCACSLAIGHVQRGEMKITSPNRGC